VFGRVGVSIDSTVKVVKLLRPDASALVVALCDGGVDTYFKVDYVDVREVMQKR
jgi:hypothetical protein